MVVWSQEQIQGLKQFIATSEINFLVDDKDGSVISGGNLAHIPGTDNVASIQLNHFLKTDGKYIYGVGFAVCKKKNWTMFNIQ